MDVLILILAYQRPIVLRECVRTLFQNTKIKPRLVYLLDDNSDAPIKQALYNFAETTTAQGLPVNVVSNYINLGVGHQFQTVYRLIEQHDPEVALICESDYFWRNEYLEDIEAVFEASPYTIAIPGTDHADMYQPHKTHGEFPKLMIDDFGADLIARNHLYKPFKLSTKRGDIDVFGVSNSCGCQILHWKRIKQFIFEELGAERDYWDILKKGFHVGGDRSRASDAAMSGVHSFLWEKWAYYTVKEWHSDFFSKNFAYLNILPSISFHAANQGINGKLDPRLYPEGGSFPGVNAEGSFPQNYNDWKRNA